MLGRIVDNLRTRAAPYASQLYSVSGTNKIVESVTVPGPNFIDATKYAAVAPFTDPNPCSRAS